MSKHEVNSGRKLRRNLLVALLTAGSVLPSQSNAAGVLSGSFVGTAFNSQFFRPPYGDFDGSLITGAFAIDLSDCSAGPAPVPYPGACLASATSFLTVKVPGQDNSFGVPETLVEKSDGASTQTLRIVFGYTAPYGQAILELVGGPEAFISGTDYSRIHSGSIDLARSTLFLSGGRSYVADVSLAALNFDQPVTGVPDIRTWSAFLLGFTLTGSFMRLKRGTIPGRRSL